MRLQAKCKPESLASRDPSRPVLTCLFLRIVELDGVRHGYLEGTDSYKLGRIPVELDDDDTEGFVTRDAIEAARKGKADRLICNGSLAFTTADGGTVSMPRPEPGKPVNADQLLDVSPAMIEGQRFTIGVNPVLLLELANAFGSDAVELEFTAVKGKPDAEGATDFRPSNLRPISVRPLQTRRGVKHPSEPIGLVMPIRVS